MSIGGAERNATRIANLLVGLGHKVFIFVLFKSRRKNFKLKKQVKVCWLNLTHARSVFKKIPIIKQYLIKLEPDIVQTWLYFSDFLSILLRLSFKSPIIWTIRCANLPLRKIKLHNFLLRKINSFFSSFVPQAIVFNSKLGERIHRIHGFNCSKAKIIRNGFCIQKNKKENVQGCNLGLIARYDPIKNHSFAFKILKNLLKQKPEVKLILSGENISLKNKSLLTNIEKNNIKNSVIINKPTTDLKILYKNINYLICPSSGEALPNSVGEAMANGIYCFTSDSGDCKELVGNAGCIIKSNDPKEWSNKILQIMKYPVPAKKRIFKNAQLQIKKNFSENQELRQYLKLYKKLLKK